MSAWLEAFRMIRVRAAAEAWVGTLALAVLGVLWLQIPDSHVWQFLFAVTSACGLIALFLWFYCRVFERAVKPEREGQWWLRWALLIVAIVLWRLLQMPIDKLMDHRELYAGYWTSRIPHSLRWLRTYEHLVLLQGWIYFSLRLVLTGLLLPIVIVAGAKGVGGSGRQIASVWSRWWYWAGALACGWITFAVSGKVLDWSPGEGLSTELVSLLLRLGFVFTLDIVLAYFVVQLVVVGLQRSGASSTK